MKASSFLFTVCSLLLRVACLPTSNGPKNQEYEPEFVGTSLRKHVGWVRRGKDIKPVLKLPYGAFEATAEKDDVWTFKNIPYAAPPVGRLRWAKPQPPLESGNQDGTQKVHNPFQADLYRTTHLEHQSTKPGLGGLDDVFGWTEDLKDMIAEGLETTSDTFADHEIQGEDCLYLDIQIPHKALTDPEVQMPVGVYIYGGGFIEGQKEYPKPLLPLYDGYPLIKSADKEMMYVVFNYRVGAFGWLAGSTMEEDAVAVPNAGLWDQRAVFQWVQDHIDKFGGDPDQVTAMGVSGGASSIIFHLIAEGGTLDPLFKRAILLSPAYVPMWDRRGEVEEKFRTFAKLAGCEGKDVMKCLRNLDSMTLQNANQGLVDAQHKGFYPVGPTPDGSYIRQLPTVELAQGNVWPIESLIVSHVNKETKDFVDRTVEEPKHFNKFLKSFLPDHAHGEIPDIKDEYPRESDIDGYKYDDDEPRERAKFLLRDSCITCNNRWLIEALGEKKTWAMEYDGLPRQHGSDAVSMFYYPEWDADSAREVGVSVLNNIFSFIFSGFIKAYRSYMASYILYGDPNTARRGYKFPYPGTHQWDHPRFEGEHVQNVMKAQRNPFDYFDPITDEQMQKSKCDFWKDFYINVTESGGYSS